MTRGDHAVIVLVEHDLRDAQRVRSAMAAARIRNPFFLVTSAEDAQEYLDGSGKFSNRSEFPLPDLILLDLNLPGSSGLRLLQRIRSDPWLWGLRVIVLTDSDDFHDINAAYELGANAFIVKPARCEDYPNLVRTISFLWLQHTRGPKLERANANNP